MRTGKAALVAVLLLGFSAVNCRECRIIPEELIATWTSPHPRYRDAYFEFEREVVVIGDREGGIASYPVTAVEREKLAGGGWISYRIVYRTDARIKCSLSFLYHPSGNGLIRFKNREDVTWFRQADQTIGR